MNITLNNNIQFQSSSEDTILLSARKSGYTISHSCLNGRCQECKVKVIDGEYDMPENQQGLTENDLEEGYCLSCITKPISNLVIEEVNFIDRILPDVKTIPVKIQKLELLTKEVIRVLLRTPPKNKFEFLAGQYLDIIYRDIKRSYSVASNQDEDLIELIIKKYPNGKFSNYIFNEAKENDLLRIDGPKGTYILPKFLEHKLIFISTGTGIAPNLSIIRCLLKSDSMDRNNIMIIHGQRHSSEHIFSLEEEFEGITIKKAISREKSKGFTHGYVQDIIQELHFDISSTQFFVCGNPKMILECREILINMGLEKQNFKSEIFINSN